MSEDVTILTLADRERWEAEHRQGGMPSQSWHYAWALQPSGYEPKLAVVRSKGARMLLPFFERAFGDTADIATIPGLSGASIDLDSSAPLFLWREYAIGRNWVSGYIQLAHTATPSGALPPDSAIVAHNEVFIFDFGKQRWDLYESLSSKFRRGHIYEAKRRKAVLIDDRTAIAERLKTLYPAAMERLGASVVFSDDTIQRWMTDPNTFALGAKIGDSIEAVHFGYIFGENAEWHIAATSERGRGLGTWLIWNAVLLAQDRGLRTLNIGGGGHVGDGLYQVKVRFNVPPTPLRSVRQIYDRARYDALCEQVGVVAEGGWFPAYRAAPAPLAAEGSM